MTSIPPPQGTEISPQKITPNQPVAPTKTYQVKYQVKWPSDWSEKNIKDFLKKQYDDMLRIIHRNLEKSRQKCKEIFREALRR